MFIPYFNLYLLDHEIGYLYIREFSRANKVCSYDITLQAIENEVQQILDYAMYC